MSFYTSLSGLKNAQTDLGVISHNIANAETNGYKKSRLEFADVVAATGTTDPKVPQGLGATVLPTTQNFSLGPIEQTGSSTDMAINGDGFFTTRSQSTGQTFYTRNGGFAVDRAGVIHDSDGNQLQIFPADTNGLVDLTQQPIGAIIPTANPNTTSTTNPAEFSGLAVGADGAVIASYSDGSNLTIGKVALASFVAPAGLRQVGSSNWEATGASGAAAYGGPGNGQYGQVLSGALERSNVDIAEELVSLITAQRNFQANAKAIDTATQLSQTIINLRS